jgi:hypothetical protein
MQATGIVEDLTAVRRAARAYREEKDAETYEGLKLMETERAIMVAGVWGVLGFRRRVLVRRMHTCLISCCTYYSSFTNPIRMSEFLH